MTAQKAARSLSLYRDYVARAGERRELFEVVARRYGVARALYAGSYVHVTPSFAIPAVVYVDMDRRTPGFFADAAVQSFVRRRSNYPSVPSVRFHHQDYSRPLDEPDASFDLLISQYAGFVSQACKRYLRPGGYLLANNSHGDASMAFADDDYELAAAVTRSGRLQDRDLGQFFVPKKPRVHSMAEIAELGRGIAYRTQAPHYVFRLAAGAASGAVEKH